MPKIHKTKAGTYTEIWGYPVGSHGSHKLGALGPATPRRFCDTDRRNGVEGLARESGRRVKVTPLTRRRRASAGKARTARPDEEYFEASREMKSGLEIKTLLTQKEAENWIIQADVWGPLQ